MKESKKTYIEDEEVWNYESNFKMLKETLTNEQFKLLTKDTKQNPLKELVTILKEYVKVGEKAGEKNAPIENTYEYLVKKYSKKFIKATFSGSFLTSRFLRGFFSSACA